MTPSERKSVAVIAVIAVLRMFGLFALLPVLALYADGLNAATPALIGLAVGGYGLTQAALQIPFGALSDRIGRRPVIWLGLCIFAAGSLIAGFSDSIYGLIAGRFLQGAGAVSATLTAMLADKTRPEVRTRSMAVLGIGIGSAFLLAFIFGPVIAAYAGTRSLFWLGALVAGLAAMLLLLVPPTEKTVKRELTRLRDAFEPALIRIDLYVFLLHAVMTALFVALPFVMARELHIAMADHWVLYVSAMLLSLLGTVPLILADERRGKRSVVGYAILLLMAGLAIMAFVVPSKLTVILSLAIFFAGFNFLEAGLPARLSLLASEASRGAAMGVYSSSQFLGAFAGGVIGGLFLGSSAGSHVFIACLVAAGLLLIAHVSEREAQ